MNTMMLSVGGSLMVPDAVDAQFLRALRDMILGMKGEMRFVMFCGGGMTARRYQEGLSNAGVTNAEELDGIGIQASVLNARLMQLIFGDEADDAIITNPMEQHRLTKLVSVGAGWKPGRSTDFVAVQCAVTHKISRVVNLSNIDFVYDADPSKHPNAKPFAQMTWQQYRELVGSAWTPGLNSPFDPIAAELAEKSGITVAICNGSDLRNAEACIRGQSFRGTTIQ